LLLSQNNRRRVPLVGQCFYGQDCRCLGKRRCLPWILMHVIRELKQVPRINNFTQTKENKASKRNKRLFIKIRWEYREDQTKIPVVRIVSESLGSFHTIVVLSTSSVVRVDFHCGFLGQRKPFVWSGPLATMTRRLFIELERCRRPDISPFSSSFQLGDR